MLGLKYALWCVPCLLATKTYASCVLCLSVFLFSSVPRLSFVPPPLLGDLSDHYWMDLDWMLKSPFIWELLYTWVGFGSYACLLKRKDVNCCWKILVMVALFVWTLWSGTGRVHAWEWHFYANTEIQKYTNANIDTQKFRAYWEGTLT